ncbi:uncharacterized protein LOC125237246 isoform X1 [Leguminivora glycinivorella]|uniref:uncharacterized protein LOC125237246 isoform X1 n=1 Tax=Leguminivora glycinivorella TaxID=1035111 RepID=UPI00200DF08E|nr:uncharacterized protein LOC125237246 isoform X1 [Leguminivora glycinivorella]
MLRILLLFYFIIAATNGHRDKLTNDADLQSELLPQELNPFFVPAAEESQMQSMPLALRLRRNSDVVTIPENTTMQQIDVPVKTEVLGIKEITEVKTYTRIIAGVVLVFSAIVEIVSYIIETYYSTSV